MELGAGEETGSERKSFFLGGVGGAQEEQTAGLSQLAKKIQNATPFSHTRRQKQHSSMSDRQTESDRLSEKRPRLDSSWYPKLAAQSSQKMKNKKKVEDVSLFRFPQFPIHFHKLTYLRDGPPQRQKGAQLCADASMHSTVQKNQR